MKEHLNQLQAKARSRLKTSGQAAFIRKQCKKIEAKLRSRTSRLGAERLLNTPGSQKAEWAFPITREVAHNPAPARPPPWTEENDNYLKQAEGFRTLQRQREKLIKKYFAARWAIFLGHIPEKTRSKPHHCANSTATKRRKTGPTRQLG